MPQHDDAHTSGTKAQNIRPGWLERRVVGRFERAVGAGLKGHLTIIFPSGGRVVLGDGHGAEAILELKKMRPILRLMTRGSLGLAESYMRDEIETNDLAGILTFCAENYERLAAANTSLLDAGAVDRWWHRRRDNTRSGSRRNIKAHYDLGNEFYASWLDPSMTYSSGIYRSNSATLDEAQAEKYRVVIEALNVASGASVLEIGCGWGGMSEALAKRGAGVHAITVSEAQRGYAEKRIAEAGLANAVSVNFQDYRDVKGTFDGIVSVEMIEAVGEAHWPAYFKTLSERLQPGARAVVQAITIDERHFETYRRQTDFIQRYIFPGGMLPTVTAMRTHAEAHGLAFATVERFGASYATTLTEWRRRFHASWPRIRGMGLDQRFRRMWELYLTYCEVGFTRGDIDVGIYVFEKPLAPASV